MHVFGKIGLFLLATVAFPVAASASGLVAGAAKVSITPTPDVFPYPYDSAHGCEPASTPGEACNFVGVHDKIYARAVVAGDGTRTVVIVLIEATVVPDAGALKSAIARAANVPEQNVLLAASHTHEVLLVGYHGGAPTAAQQREIDRIETGAVAAVREAKRKMRPARIAFGRGTGWINVNNGDSVGDAGYNPLGPSDKSLDVVKIDGADERPIALLVNYASHAEVMYRSVTKNGGYEVSGDVPGVVSASLESIPGMAPVALFSASAEGDQITLFKSAQHQDGPLPFKDNGAAGWGLLDTMARRLTRSVIDVVARAAPGVEARRVDAAAGTVLCPGQHRHLDPGTGRFISEPTSPVSIPLSVIRFDDIALTGVGGDVGSEIGTAAKRASPVANTMFVSMLAGSVGYVLADASYARDSHGVTGSPLKPQCAGPAIVDGLAKLTTSLLRKP